MDTPSKADHSHTIKMPNYFASNTQFGSYLYIIIAVKSALSANHFIFRTSLPIPKRNSPLPLEWTYQQALTVAHNTILEDYLQLDIVVIVKCSCLSKSSIFKYRSPVAENKLLLVLKIETSSSLYVANIKTCNHPQKENTILDSQFKSGIKQVQAVM